jgi:limonene-1,2-epoxide hydrolase
MTSEQIVTAFIRALERNDLDEACTYVTDDIEYDNVPLAKVHGPAALRSTLEPFFGMCSAIDWVIHHQAATGDVVMNERTDRFEMGGRWVELGVAGLFVLRDGKIALWRDYFDLGAFQKMMSPG